MMGLVVLGSRFPTAFVRFTIKYQAYTYFPVQTCQKEIMITLMAILAILATVKRCDILHDFKIQHRELLQIATTLYLPSNDNNQSIHPAYTRK